MSVRRTLTLTIAAALSLSLAACSHQESTAPSPQPSASSAPASPSPSPKPSAKPKPAPVDPLSGGKPSKNEVFAVKIDNVAAARPQIGISQADIIVVEEVEARLTRLVAIFHTDFPSRVGPVRSARNTDVEFLPIFGRPGLIYSGANRKVQDNVRASKNLVPIERSDRDRSRIAPHNVVVDLGDLAKDNKVGAARDIGWSFAASDPRWSKAKGQDSWTDRIGGDSYSFTKSGGGYSIAVNSDGYDDAATKKKLNAANVVVLSVKNRKDRDTTSSLSIVSDTVGSGKVEIHRDGKVLTGTWKRSSKTAPMTFTDGDGKDIPLKPGQTWLLLQG